MNSPAQPGAYHEISWNRFDALACGRTSPEIVRLLQRAELSRVLLLLRAILEQAVRHPEVTRGPLPPPDTAWDLLTRVQERAPAALDAVLAYPYVGSWASHTLRRLRGRASEQCPLWVHVGHLHSLAAVAAIRAGLDVHLQVPARDGAVTLPTMGLALPSATVSTSALPATRWSVAEISSSGGRTEIRDGGACVCLPDDPADDTPGWWGLRSVDIRAGKSTLSVRLDDLDPYRGIYGPLEPRRLDNAELRVWRGLLTDAWELVCLHLPERAEALCVGLRALVPLPPHRRGVSASSSEAFGGAHVARPTEPSALAATLVHEFQHIQLGGLLHLVKLHEDDQSLRFYSPWRDDPRPLGGLVQGVYAFFGVTEFWRALSGTTDNRLRRTATFEYARWRAPTWQALRTLQDDQYLTEAGRRFFDGVATRLSTWQDEPLPADVTTAADAVAVDHMAGWKLRHLRPDPALVAGIVRAWPTASTAAGIPTAADPDGPWSHARADLILRSVEGACARPDCGDTENIEATPADRAYAEGRHADAERAYRAELAADPDCPTSWIGFALAWSSVQPGPGATLLLQRPELVRAVHRELRAVPAPPEPDVLATWIAIRWPDLTSPQDSPRTEIA